MEERAYNGYRYTRGSAGEAWQIAGPARAPASVRVAGNPDPFRVSADARDNTRLSQEQTRLQIALEAERRAREDDARKAAALAARGGVETTENERNAAFLTTRLAGGIRKLGEIGLTDAPSLKEGILGGTKAGPYAVSDERQRVINAQLDMLDAALTLGTGAAYSKEQLEGYRQSYFPVPGEGAGAIADKQERLRVLLEAAKLKSGAAAPQIDEALSKSGMFAPATAAPPAGPPISADQAKLYDAFMTANPQATPEQLQTFATQAGLGTIANAAEIVAARNKGAGVQPGSAARYGDSYMAQGMSGVNEGVASTLGAIPDLATGVLNLVPRGINAVANADIPLIEDPFMGSDWWKDRLSDAGTIYPGTGEAGKQFTRRVGQSVGGAAIPVAGTATTAARGVAGLLAAGAGGVGAATANQVFPGNPYADMAGDVAGSLLAGGGAMAVANNRARSVAEGLVPTVPQLRQQASNQYSAAEARGVVAGPNVTANLSGRIDDIARREELITPTGRVSGDYPRAGEAMHLLQDYSGRDMNVRQIQVVRDTLADAVQATEGKERRIARQMLNAFDEETVPLAPELTQARNTASRYISADTIQRKIDLAEPRAAQYSQSGTANALRTDFRALDRDIVNGNEQFNPAATEAIQNVSRGTPGTNLLSRVGKFAPRGPVSAMASGGVPFAIGTAIGGPTVGAALSGTTMAGGTIAQILADRAVARNASVAEMLARNGGELQVAPTMDDHLRRQIAAQLAATGGGGY